MDELDTSTLVIPADAVDLDKINYNSNYEQMPEVAPVNPDILKNPEKYMKLEIRQIEEEERKLAEAEDMKNGKPLDIRAWKLLQRERSERKQARIDECRARWKRE